MRIKNKGNKGLLEGSGRSFTSKPPRKGPKKKRSPFSLDPSLITSNLDKVCIRCNLSIPAHEPYWWYPKLAGCVHKSCSKKV